MFKSFNNVI